MAQLRIRSAGAGTIRTAALAVATVVLLVWMASGPLHAAQLRVTDPDARNDPTELFFRPRCHLTLKGEIFPGDAERIRREVQVLEKRYEMLGPSRGGSGFLALCLASPGGDLGEALKLWAVFYGWMMVVDEGAECVSACAMLFMRSKRRDHIFSGGNNGYSIAGRYLHHKGRLGFHAPRLQLPGAPEALVTKGQAGEAYVRALATVRELLLPRTQDPDASGTASLDALRKSEVNFNFVGWGRNPLDELPLDLVVAFLVTPPNEFYWITSIEEALHWGIEIFGIAPPRKLTASMLMMACANVASVRCAHGRLRKQCPDGFEAHQSRYYDTQTKPDDEARKHFTVLMNDYKPGKVTLWPRPGQRQDGYFIQAFRVAESNAFPTPTLPCAIRATWKNDRLFDIEVQTFNGDETNWLGAQMSVAAQDLKQIEDLRGDGDNHLRPWKMLPLGTKLSDLGGPKPWGWLDDGPDFFDRPARW